MNLTEIEAGWIPGLTVRDFVLNHSEEFSLLPYVLLSSIDSEPSVARMPWARAWLQLNPSWALSVEPFVVSGAAILELDLEAVFNGFDELWILSQPRVPKPPRSAYIVTPRRLDASVPEEVLKWMEESECRLGVGDGEGLNFVSADLDLSRRFALPV